MLANHRHPEVAAVLAAVLARQREAQVAGAIGAPLGFGQQRLPFGARQTAAVEVGARPLPAVIEEAFVVVLGLERLDLAVDERIEFAEIGHQFGGQGKIHVDSLKLRVAGESGVPGRRTAANG